MRDLGHIASAKLAIGKKSSVDKCIIDGFQDLNNTELLVCPFIDIGNKKRCAVGPFDAIAHCFRIFISVRYEKRGNTEVT